MGVPLAGLSILLGIDRIPDMFRTSVNLMGQMTTAVVVDTWVGGEDPGTAVDASRDAPGQPQA